MVFCDWQGRQGCMCIHMSWGVPVNKKFTARKPAIGQLDKSWFHTLTKQQEAR